MGSGAGGGAGGGAATCAWFGCLSGSARCLVISADVLVGEEAH